MIPLPHWKFTFLVVPLQAFVPFQGCFEKVEEWLDENKHVLGTIGMVILVVQVGGFFLSTFFFFVPLSHLFFSSPISSIALCLSAFVCVCLSGYTFKKLCASNGLCATIISLETYEAWAQWAFWVPTHLEILESLSSAPYPVWENQSYLALCQADCSRVKGAIRRQESRDTKYSGAAIESQIKCSVERGDRYSSDGTVTLFVLNSLNPSLFTQFLVHFSLFAVVFSF